MKRHIEKKCNFIYIDIRGQLGNQLFQYAFARVIQLNDKFHRTIVINFRKNPTLRWGGNNLSFFNTNFKTIDDSNVLIVEKGTQFQIKLKKAYHYIRKFRYLFFLRTSFHVILQKNGIYQDDESFSYRVRNIPHNKNVFIQGYFENPAYFDDIRDILLEEYTPKYGVLDTNARLYETILNTDSVCVSFRTWKELERGSTDYIDRCICSKEYYERAFEIMHNLRPNAVFIIFSDDVQYVKQNFSFKYHVYFEGNNAPIYEKLRLMYSCKHFILSNSTFAWWAQYLCRNEGKIVISPKTWKKGTKSKLVLDKWITIETLE